MTAIVRQDRRLAVAAIFSLLALSACDKKENAYVPPPPPDVGVMHPITRAVAPYVETNGSVVAYNQVDVMARVQGFVQQIAYKDGEHVKAGQLLFVIEPAPWEAKLQQAQATVAGDQAKYDYSALEFTRYSTLAQTAASSQAQADQWRATRNSDKAKLDTDQAQTVLAAIDVGYTHVMAPFDGVVTNHQVSLGQLVGVNAPTTLASVVQLDPIYVTFTVDDRTVQAFHAAARAKGLDGVRSEDISIKIGLTSQSGYPFEGRLDYVSPTADASTGTMMARAILPNPNHDLQPGYYVHVRVAATNLAAPALLVPEAALGADQQGRYVLVVGKDDVVEQRHVEAGQEEGALRVITAELKTDDNVIVSGLERAIPGGKVAPHPAEPPAS
jgi:multidrug efflux system membrane fusion protein